MLVAFRLVVGYSRFDSISAPDHYWVREDGPRG